MNTRYATSKIMLTCASVLAFTGIATWVGINGPFGSSANAQVQSQQQSPVTQRVRIRDDDGQAYTITIPRNSPVARSRGS
jgi:hypothetical protein